METEREGLFFWEEEGVLGKGVCLKILKFSRNKGMCLRRSCL